MAYVALHVHSQYSFHAGLPDIPELVSRAKALGFKALALTDTDRMSGLILFYLECRKQGIQPILGATLTHPKHPERRVVALARNAEGYGDLCELLTLRHCGSEGEALDFAALWRRPWEGLHFLAPHPETLMLLYHSPNRGRLHGELLNQDRSTRAMSRQIERLCDRHSLPLVAAHESFFLDSGDWELHRILCAIGHSSTLSRLRPDEYAPPSAWLKGPREMEALFPRHGEALANSARIADACRVELPLGKWIMPEIDVPEGHTPDTWLERLAREGLERNYGTAATRACSRAVQPHGADSGLGGLARAGDRGTGGEPASRAQPHGARASAPSAGGGPKAETGASGLCLQRPKPWPPTVPTDLRFTQNQAWQRIARDLPPPSPDPAERYARAREIQKTELEVIRKLGYSSYFLMVKQVRDWANEHFHSRYRRPRDCTILRGSAANSITFFNLDVSDLDPIRYNLYFQRFLNEDRASPPDADLDFGWDERDAALEHMVERFGRERVAITCTTNHFRYRAAFRECAKVFGYTEEQITEILDSFQTRSRRLEDPDIRRIFEMAARIRGKPRFLGQHPGGLLITNRPIRRHVACEYSGGEKNRLITQVDMHNGIDELGLIKFDLLGNGSLSVLRDALAQLEEQGLPDPEVWDLDKCYSDPKVQEIIATGRTRGIFYIESPAQSRLNAKADARDFEEISITSSLVRPAGAAYTQSFVERHRKWKHGLQDWDFLHPALEPILRETHDVCAFQEDVTKICHHVAGLGYKKSDRIRKMMNSMHEGRLAEAEYREAAGDFIEGSVTHSGLSREQALELWERVSSFTGFSFCKSHSASYAQLSFQCTWLKAHYPAQFLAAVISNNHGFYSRDIYLDEARRWGLRILPLDINASRIKYRGKHDWLRPGTMHVRNLRSGSQEAIQRERERGGSFRNLEDFLARVPVGRKETEGLILVGGFDGFGMSRPELVFELDAVYGKLRPGQPDLFSGLDAMNHDERHPGLGDYSFMQRCLHELHYLGYMISGDLLAILELHPAAKGAVPAAELARHVGRRVKVFGKPINDRVHVVAKGGRLMKFLTLEDRTGQADVIFWPQAYDRFADTLIEPGPFEVWGKVTEDWGTFNIEAERVRRVEWSPNQVDFDSASQRLLQSRQRFLPYHDPVRPGGGEEKPEGPEQGQRPMVA